MTEEEILFLLNSELDGEIAEPDRLLLAEHLAREPGARVVQQELNALNTLLAGVPEVEPPEGLCIEIINRLPTLASAESGSPRSAKVYRLWPRSVKESLKPVLSLAATVIVAVALVQLVPDSFDPREIEQASGTMVQPAAGSLVIEQSGLSASVSITPSDTSLLVDVKLDSAINTSTLIEVPKNQYSLKPPGGQGPGAPGVKINNYSLEISSVGTFEARVLLERADELVQAGEDTIRVRFMQAGRTVHESTLRIPEQKQPQR